MSKDINQEIEEAAEQMAKSTQDSKEQLFSIIKALGPEGLKQRLHTLSDEEKVLLKSAIEEMNTLKKAVSFDKEAQSAKPIHGKETDTILQEEIASDDADEKLVKPEANKQNHQGTPTDGWSGEVVKGPFKKLENELSEEKGVTDPAGLAAEIGRKKEGKQAFQNSAEEGKKKMKKSEIEENLDLVIEKAMEKCKDDKLVMKKLKEKGMEDEKVEGAMNRYKAKKEDMEKAEKESKEKKEAKDKLMEMEEKEHGTKDPKKLVEDEKKEHAEKKMKKSDDSYFKRILVDGQPKNVEITKSEYDELAKAGAKILKEEDQLGDAPEMNEKTFGKKEAAPNVTDVPQASVDAQKDVKNTKKITKSVQWENENALLKANTLGRNFNFNVENFIVDTIAKGEQTEEVIQKAEKEDLNEIIAKSMDKNWDDIKSEKDEKENKKKQNGKIVKSFEDDDLATILGLTPEEAKKILG